MAFGSLQLGPASLGLLSQNTTAWGAQTAFYFSPLWKLEVQDQGEGDLAAGESRFLGLQTAAFSLHLHVEERERARMRTGLFLFLQSTNPIMRAPPPGLVLT